MSVTFVSTIPILRIFDVDKALEFYRDFLGFTVDWEHRFDDNSPAYIQVSRAGLALHLSEHYGDCCPGSAVCVMMTGIREFHAELARQKYKYLRPGLEQTFHGTEAVEVIDPFGNKIRFNEKIVPQETQKQQP